MLPAPLPRSAFGSRAALIVSRVALGIALCIPVASGLAQTAHFGSAPRTVVTGLFSPFGVAADAAGDLYVADSGNNRVVKYVPSAGSYTRSAVFDVSIPCGSATPCGLNTPYGVAVDAAGNVFIADLGNNRVVKETLSGGSYTQSTVAAASQPNAVAVDSGGNVYIASTGGNQVLVEMPVTGGYTSLTTITGLNSPKGVAVDAGGVVYVADTGSNRVLKETPGTGGSYIPSVVASTSATYDYPFGVAVSANGVVYYSDYNASASSSEVVRATPVGGGYAVGVVAGGGTAPLGYGMALDQAGNLFVADAGGGDVLQLKLTGADLLTQAVPGPSGIQPLTFAFDTGGVLGSYQVLTQGAAGLDFADAGGGTCTVGTTYNAGAVCTVIVAFTPRFPGMRQGAVTLQNSSGVVIATGYLQGVGTGPQVGFTPGTISTVAGNGTQCASSTAVCGDGGAATSANLWNPAGVAADAAGNLYIADADDNRIRKVTPGGTISTVAGTGATGGAVGDGGPATGAQLYYPNGVAIDGAGNLYIADTSHHRIRRVDAATGIITTVAGTGTLGSGGDGGAATLATLNSPYGVALDGQGNVYVADTYSNKIRKVTVSTGVITVVAGTGVSSSPLGDGGPAIAANLSVPYGAAFNGAGNLFIADRGNQRIREVNAATGIITTVAGNGSGGFAGDGGPAGGAEFQNPYSVAIDAAGNLYIADLNNLRIRKVAVATGIITTLTGTGADASTGDGGVPSAASVGAPVSVALDGTGNLYIAEYDTHRIRRISAAAHPLTFAATALGNTSSDSPQTVTLNNTGNTSLTLAVPSTTGNRNPSVSTGFLYGSGSNCPQLGSTSSAFVLAAGASCTELLSFAPQTAGTFSGSSVSMDNALNVAGATQTVTLTGIATQGTPSVTVTPASTTYGATSTTLTATVTFSGVADSGAVTFAVDGGAAVSGSCGATGAYTESCTASYNTAALTGWTHTISATVAADANYVTSSGTGTLTVGKASPTVTVAAASAVYGSASATLSAGVAYTAAAAPTGALSFTVDSGTAVTATCTGTSSPLRCTASYPTASLGAGSHVLTASETADTNYNQATGTGTLAITQATPTMTASPVSVAYGTASTTLTATVTYTGAAPPTGGVSFTVDGGTAFAAVCAGSSPPLTCSASFGTASLSGGGHTLLAALAADTNYAAAASGPATLTVTPVAPGITLGTLSIPYGTAAAALTATLTYGGAVAPTRSPTFAVDGGAALAGTCAGSASPLRCTVSYPSSALTAGTHTVTVALAADANYTALSRSGTVLTVTQATPVLNWATPAPVSYGTALTAAQLDATADVQGSFVYSPTFGAVPPVGTQTLSVTFTPTDTIDYTAATRTAPLTVNPSAPVCGLSVQGTSTALTVVAVGSCSDPQGQPLTTVLDWGDKTTTAVSAARNVHTYATAGTYTVVLSATDTAGLTGKAQQQTIPNQTPVCTLGSIQASSATPGAGTVSYVFSVTASCSDPQGQPLSATIDWGDGTTQAGLANGVNSHPYANPATTRTYNVVLTATDGAGLAGTATQSVMVVPAPTSTPGTPAAVSATIAPQPASVPAAQLTVSFLCSSVLAVGSTTPALPAQYGISCSSTPQTVQTTATVQANITITSTAATSTVAVANEAPGRLFAWCVLLFPLPGFGFFALGARAHRRRGGFRAMGVLLMLCLMLTSCGGSFIPPSQVATPVGTYFITVTEVAACTSSSVAACPALPTGFVQTSLIVPLTIHP